MKRSVKILVLLLFVANYISAQYSTDWIRPADSNAKTGSMIARDKTDNVIVVGHVQSSNIYTRKYDKFGNFQWEKTSSSGIQSNYEKAIWVNTDKNKNIYVVGKRYVGTSQEFPNAVVVLKYNAAGTLLWKQNIPIEFVAGSSSGYSFNLRSEVDKAGNLYIGTSSTGQMGFVLIKLNPSGVVLFNHDIPAAGGTYGFSSMRLKGDKIIMTGKGGNNSAAVAAWDLNGNLLWNTALIAPSVGYDVEFDANFNVFVLSPGNNQVSPTSGQDIVIFKLDPNGNQIWKKNYDFGGQDFPQRFTYVSNKLSVIGYGSINASYFDWITFQVNKNGVMLWNTRYNGTGGNDEYPYFLAAKSTGEVFVTGVGGPSPVQGQASWLRMITLKYDNAGTTKWVDSLSIYSGWGIACTLASDNSLFVVSSTNMTAYHFLDHTGTGSCGIPTGLNVSNVTGNSALFSWSAIPEAYLYHLRYKTSSAVEWTTISTNTINKLINTLSTGTSYQYQVEAICSSGPSGYGPIQTFSTTGAGYCNTGGLSTAQEFLNLVWIGGIQNLTQQTNNGYSDFTNLSTPLTQGALVSGYLSPGLAVGIVEYYSVWIDYNHDNDFTDAGEQAVNISSDFSGFIAINFTVPANATPGTTRMRVTIKNGSTPSPCGTYDRGETEDYTVIITTPFAGQTNLSSEVMDDTPVSVQYFPNPFVDKITLELPPSSSPSQIFVYDITGKMHFTTEWSEWRNELDMSGFNSGIYMVVVIQEGKLPTSFKIIKQ